MTLVTLSSGGVFTWLLVRRAHSDLAESLGPELGRLAADIQKLAAEDHKEHQRTREAGRPLEERLESIEAQQRALLGRLPEQAKSPPAQASGAELERALAAWRDQAERQMAGLEQRLEQRLRTQAEASETRWTTEAARWAGQGGKLDHIEAHLSALGGRLGDVLEGLEDITGRLRELFTEQQATQQAALAAAAECALLAPGRESARAPQATPSEATGSAQADHSPDSDPAEEEPQLSAGRAEGARLAQAERLETLAQLTESLRSSLAGLEAELEQAQETASVARAENVLLRQAGQAEIQRLAERTRRQFGAIASELSELERTLESSLRPGARA
jgi:hypothetical protein